MTTIELKVKGMACSHCENAVNKALSALNGVESVIASAKKASVLIAFDESIITKEKIAHAITDAGYEVID